MLLGVEVKAAGAVDRFFGRAQRKLRFRGASARETRLDSPFTLRRMGALDRSVTSTGDHSRGPWCCCRLGPIGCATAHFICDLVGPR